MQIWLNKINVRLSERKTDKGDEKEGKVTYKLSKSEVELMVWEVDDDADGLVSKDEFFKMYKRWKADKLGLEPRKLFNLVYFLMFRPMYTGFVTEEDTLQLLFVRYNREKLDEEINAIFGEEQKYPAMADDKFIEREISYPDYIKKVNERAMNDRKRRKEEKKQWQMLDNKSTLQHD